MPTTVLPSRYRNPVMEGLRQLEAKSKRGAKKPEPQPAAPAKKAARGSKRGAK